MPKGAESQKAPNGGALFRSLSLFGISRRLGFRAVRDSAPSGIRRRSAFRAVRRLAPL